MSNKIVFFGSGPVAAKSLELLLQDFEVEAVITKPTTEREMKAAGGDAPLYSVSNKAELDTLIDQNSFESEVGILIDFGIMVSQKVIDSFPLGIINSHFSILPQWRGADPINFAILSGQEVTGVSLMLLVEAMDEGPLLTYSTYKLGADTDSTKLTNDLVHISYDMLKRTVPQYLAGEVVTGDQSQTKYPVSYSRKLTKEDGILDFNKSAKELEAEVRAFIQWPKSRTELAGKDVVITKASVNTTLKGTIGEVFKTEDKKIGIYTKQGAFIIEELKPAGKNAMAAHAFLAGYGNKL
jgi:methionyl-tRNA formyltransferase